MQQLPIIQSLWIGDELSTMERLCIASFIKNGHPFHLYTYDYVKNVPEGTIIKDANEIIPTDKINYKVFDSYATFADIFRYKLLLDKGGYWVDTDNICLRPFTHDLEYLFSSERGNRIDDTSQKTNIGILKAPPGSNVIRYCYNEAVRIMRNEISWGDIGPKLMAKAVKKFGLESYVVRPEEFCYIHWWDWEKLIDGSTDKSFLDNIQSVHMWNDMWSRNNIDKNAKFDENSIYEWLKKKYLDVPLVNTSPLIVSICVMSYNLENYIAEALDSILMQNVNFRYDIIVSDDYSTDNTRKILQEYVDKYPEKFVLLLQEKNIGMVPNFVEALKACKGKYIALLDGDDYWTDPMKLQKQVDFLESHKDYSMVYHNIELHDETINGVKIKPFNREKRSREYTYDEILRNWTVGTCSVVCINNEQYQYIEKNMSFFPVQDLPFYLATSSRGKIYYLSETMSVYRRLLSGSLNSEKSRSPQIHFKFIEYFKILYRDFSHILSKETIKYVTAFHYLYAAHKSKNNGLENDYLKYLTLAMEHDPILIFEQELKTILYQDQVHIHNQHHISLSLFDKIKKINADYLVSVVIPCFNQAPYLTEAVESIIQQTYPNVEIIIVNDGSTDNTQEIALNLEEKYPGKIHIVTQKNMGLSAARNNGIAQANGNYIVPLDADDILSESMILNCIQTMKSLDVDIVYGDYERFGKVKKRHYKEPFEIATPLYHSPCSATALYKKEVWEKIGGYKKNMIGGYEDWEFWINAYKHNFKFQHLFEVLFYYRIKEESMFVTANKSDEFLKAKIVLNHPELYTDYKVQKSINIIKKTESLPTHYFYYPDDIVINEKEILPYLVKWLESDQNDENTIEILNSTVILYDINSLSDQKALKETINNNHSRVVLFYSTLRHKIAGLKATEFSWDKEEGLVQTHGTVFPFLYKNERENLINQSIACKRLEEYNDQLQLQWNKLYKKYTESPIQNTEVLKDKYKLLSEYTLLTENGVSFDHIKDEILKYSKTVNYSGVIKGELLCSTEDIGKKVSLFEVKKEDLSSSPKGLTLSANKEFLFQYLSVDTKTNHFTIHFGLANLDDIQSLKIKSWGKSSKIFIKNDILFEIRDSYKCSVIEKKIKI